jgi:hypothetical protein
VAGTCGRDRLGRTHRYNVLAPAARRVAERAGA